MERSARPRRRGLRTLLAPATDNWLSRGYLAVVGASIGFFLYAAYVAPDVGFAAIWPFLATAPLGALGFLLMVPVESVEWLSPLVFSAGVAAAGLVNATLLGLLAGRLRTPGPRPASY